MAFKMKSGSPFQRNFGVGKSPVKQTKYFGKPKQEEEEIPTMDFLKNQPVHAAESTGMGKSNIELEMEADARDNEQKLKDFKENNKAKYDQLVEEWKNKVGDQFSTSLGYQDLYQHSGPKQPFPIPKWMGGEWMGKWSTSGQAKIHKDKQASLDSFILSKI